MSFIDGIGSYLGSKDSKNRNVKKDKFAEYSWLVFSDEDYEGYKRSSNIKCAVLAVIAVLVSLAAFIAASRSGKDENISAIVERGDSPKEIGLELSLEYMGQSIEEDVFLTVLPKKIDEASANVLFDECEQWIRDVFSEGLRFPEKSPNGVGIGWQNSDFSYIGIEEPAERVFIAQLAVGEFSRLSEFTVVVDPSAENYKDSLSALARALQDSLSRSETGDSLELPKEEGGAVLNWMIPEKQSPTAIVAIGLFIAAMFVLGRRDAEKKQLKRRQEQFENEVPSLSFQLMLYLNAGLTLDGAFSRILKQNMDNHNPLYRALRDIKSKADAGNVPFVSELYSYARRCGSASFLRLATLGFEHSARGTELSAKLEQERLRMHEERVSKVQTRIKTAETKLCFPLMLLLVALVLITAVPSFLSM